VATLSAPEVEINFLTPIATLVESTTDIEIAFNDDELVQP
jgi:hypothetical protein